jgi:ferredoxin
MRYDGKKKGIENTVRIITAHADQVARTPAGTGLLNLLDQHHVMPGTYCNGKGICGKCRVRVAPIDASGFTPEERGVLSPFELKQGYRLACQATVNGDLTVYAESDHQFAIVTAGSGAPERFNPMVCRERLTVTAPTLNDQTADADRLALQVGGKSVAWNLQMLQAVSALPLDREASLTIVRENERIGGDQGDALNLLT